MDSEGKRKKKENGKRLQLIAARVLRQGANQQVLSPVRDNRIFFPSPQGRINREKKVSYISLVRLPTPFACAEGSGQIAQSAHHR